MDNTHCHSPIKRSSTTGDTPKERLAHFFAMLETMPVSSLSTATREELMQYLISAVKSLQVHQPELLARQIFFMAVEAHVRQGNAPDTYTLKHVKIAADALIAAQSKHHLSKSRWLYATVASCLLIFAISGGMMINSDVSPQMAENLNANISTLPEKTVTTQVISSPKRLSEMLSDREKMRQGTCNFPEALMLAEADREIYLKTVVFGEIPYSTNEQEATARLMQFVRCDYAPMLMKNSIS